MSEQECSTLEGASSQLFFAVDVSWAACNTTEFQVGFFRVCAAVGRGIIVQSWGYHSMGVSKGCLV